MKQEDFRRILEGFEPSKEIKDKILSGNKPGNRVRKKLITAATVLTALFLTSATVLATVNYSKLAELFRSTFHDDVSAENIEQGRLQELGLTQSNEELSLTLNSFMGDSETHIVLFEMEYYGEINEAIKSITLTGRTTNVTVSEEEKYHFATKEIQAYEVTLDDNTGKIYGKYILPPYWVSGTSEDVVIDILEVDIRLENSLQTIHADTDFEYTFAPDHSILKPALTIPVDTVITKETNALAITKIVFSQYKTELNCTIQNETSTIIEGRAIWERFAFDYYSEDTLNWISNNSFIRLFADGTEVKTKEEFKEYYPGSGRYCAMIFQPVDYLKAQNIELRFGDKIIPIEIPQGLEADKAPEAKAEENESKIAQADRKAEKTPFDGLVSDKQAAISGNTNLNYFWNGNLCAGEGAVYYRNDENRGYLYKREEDGRKAKIYEAAVSNINFMNGFIYFINEDDNNSICRIDPTGENYCVIRPGMAYRLMLTQDRIFFLDKDNYLYKMDYEGRQADRLIELNADDVWWINVYKDYLIYSSVNDDFAVYCYDTAAGKEYKILYYGFYPVVYGDYLYYQSADGGVSQCNLTDGSVKALFGNWGQQFAVVQNTVYFTDYQSIWKYSLENTVPPEIVLTTVNKEDPYNWVYLNIRINKLYADQEEVYFDITENGTDKLIIYHTDTGTMEGF